MKRRTLTTAHKVAIFLAAQCRCHICGALINPQHELWEVEHVIPLAMGGKDDETNLRPAHKSCHAPKTVLDQSSIAKAKRLEARRLGIRKTPTMPGSRGTRWRKKLDGTVMPR